MADDKKKDARAAWDEADVEEAKNLGVTPSVAKVLLAMNPQLREQGLDTMKVVRESQNAGAGVGAKQSAPAGGGSSIYDTLKLLDQDVSKAQADLNAKLAALEAERQKLLAAACDIVSQWLLKNDPDILSPVTQKALKDFEKLTKSIGFKTETYITKHRSKR